MPMKDPSDLLSILEPKWKGRSVGLLSLRVIMGVIGGAGCNKEIQMFNNKVTPSHYLGPNNSLVAPD